ncbi:NAD(P) transhydrogenase alpha subunit [Streptomyces sp. PAMC 26508]|nr:NAD(P) transhydrogenase alpha subunit [Streptomyces sp. PAMC 26508]
MPPPEPRHNVRVHQAIVATSCVRRIRPRTDTHRTQVEEAPRPRSGPGRSAGPMSLPRPPDRLVRVPVKPPHRRKPHARKAVPRSHRPRVGRVRPTAATRAPTTRRRRS